MCEAEATEADTVGSLGGARDELVAWKGEIRLARELDEGIEADDEGADRYIENQEDVE